MYSSGTGYPSPSISPPRVSPAPLYVPPLCGLGLSNCHFLPGTNEVSLKPSCPVGSPSRRSWLSHQAGQEQICISTEQNAAASSCAASDLISATASSMFPDLVQEAAKMAATHPTSTPWVEHICSSGLNSFDSCQYRTASSSECQTPYYVARSSAITDCGCSCCNFEQECCPTTKVSSFYSTHLRLESPTMSHTIFASSEPEAPTGAVNSHSVPIAESHLGFGMGGEALQSQNRTNSYMAFSWPGDHPYLEQSKEVDVRETKKREDNQTTSRRPCSSRNKSSHVARRGDHRTTRVRVRVPCNYGNGCRQAFNRKTDLYRHIHTVRHRWNFSHKIY
jgi:hypothetical protein